MVERPSESTYVAELVSVIKEVGRSLGFDAETEYITPSGRPDVKLLYKGRTVAVIEVKKPEISLSDPNLMRQARKYADWYLKKYRVKYYGIQNMKYLMIFKYQHPQRKGKTLYDYAKKKAKEEIAWVPITDFPFEIVPWATSIMDYKQISIDRRAKKNLEKFLLKFREQLEGRTIDLSKEVIQMIRSKIEEGAVSGLPQLFHKYRTNKEIRKIVDSWIEERGLKKPKNDNELRNILKLLLKEQLYTFSMKILFYLVLQTTDAEMAAKLREKIVNITPTDPDLFKAVFD